MLRINILNLVHIISFQIWIKFQENIIKLDLEAVNIVKQFLKNVTIDKSDIMEFNMHVPII